MSPPQDPPQQSTNQAGLSPRCVARRARQRKCLLKGCEKWFRPRWPTSRYCRQECRTAARRWREWKARHKYRKAEAGRQKRRAQSRRYRERVRERKAQGWEISAAVEPEGHPQRRRRNFFHPQLRPARLLRRVRLQSAVAAATFLRKALSASGGAGCGAGATMERADQGPEVVKGQRRELGRPEEVGDRLHILREGVELPIFQVPWKRKGGRGEVGIRSVSSSLLLMADGEKRKWNWSFSSSSFGTSR